MAQAVAEEKQQAIATGDYHKESHQYLSLWMEGGPNTVISIRTMPKVAEGFCLSEEVHGLRYMRVIGDGDSSVMATIIQSVPYGLFVENVECANHACKRYCSPLEVLAKDHPEFRGKGGLQCAKDFCSLLPLPNVT